MKYSKVATVGDIKEGEIKRVELEGIAIAVVNLEGEYFAISDTCSHEEASLSEGELDGNVITCPKHGSRFDVKTGRALSLPAMFPVPNYEVKVEGTDIKVATGD